MLNMQISLLERRTYLTAQISDEAERIRMEISRQMEQLQETMEQGTQIDSKTLAPISRNWMHCSLKKEEETTAATHWSTRFCRRSMKPPKEMGMKQRSICRDMTFRGSGRTMLFRSSMTCGPDAARNPGR